MIETPSCDAAEFEAELDKSTTSLHRRAVTPQCKLIQKVQHLLHGNTIATYYLRMAWSQKLSFLNEVIARIRSLDTMRLILNTLHTVGKKITSYCRMTTHPVINYDKILYDHNRMLDDQILQENIHYDLIWYENLEDQEQVSYLIALLRLSAQEMIRIFMKNLKIAYEKRLKSCTFQSEKIMEDQISEPPEFVYAYDPNDPKHQKCLDLEKQWDKSIGELRKKVEKEKKHEKKETSKKTKTKETHKKTKKKETSKKAKKKQKKKNKDKSDDQPLDWIQTMPIIIVKKIFSHLDKKSLTQAKKVNLFWKWAVEELIKDRKACKTLKKMDRKLKKPCGGECKFSEAEFHDPKPRISCTDRRVEKLQNRGAIIEELRQTSRVADNEFALIVEFFKNSKEMELFFSKITMYPRVVRTNSPIYKRPAYIVKDLGLISEETEELSDSEDDLTRESLHIVSSIDTGGSDEF